jgi:hypothetical protein
MTDARISGVAREVLVAENAPLRVSQLAREVLVAENAPLRVSRLAREVLWGLLPPLRVSGLVREVLLSSAWAPAHGSMIWAGGMPVLGAFAPAAGSMVFTGGMPAISHPTRFTVPPGALTFIGKIPVLTNDAEAPFDWRATVISQYQASPIILQIVANMAATIDPRLNFDAFFNLIWNVQTAQGIGLDIWGRIVGCSRIIEVPSAGAFLGFEEAGDPTARTPWNQAPWFSGATASSSFPLTDDAFRLLIYAKALANITDGSIPGLNAILLTLFPGRGDAFVTDGGDMTMTYEFEFPLTPVELAIVSSAGILPTPTGVSATVVQS